MGSDPCVILGVTTCMCVQMIQSSCFNGLARSRYIIVGKESYFNYVLGAGSYDCFLEELKEGGNAEVEYHVSGPCVSEAYWCACEWTVCQ